MGPCKAAHHANREIRAKNFTLVGVVMADRGHTAQQILQRAPPEAYWFGHLQVLANRTAVRMVDVAGPFTRIRVGTAAQLGEAEEFLHIADEIGRASCRERV